MTLLLDRTWLLSPIYFEPREDLLLQHVTVDGHAVPSRVRRCPVRHTATSRTSMKLDTFASMRVCLGFRAFNDYRTGFIVRPQGAVSPAKGALTAIQGLFGLWERQSYCFAVTGRNEIRLVLGGHLSYQINPLMSYRRIRAYQ